MQMIISARYKPTYTASAEWYLITVWLEATSKSPSIKQTMESTTRLVANVREAFASLLVSHRWRSLSAPSKWWLASRQRVRWRKCCVQFSTGLIEWNCSSSRSQSANLVGRLASRSADSRVQSGWQSVNLACRKREARAELRELNWLAGKLTGRAQVGGRISFCGSCCCCCRRCCCCCYYCR